MSKRTMFTTVTPLPAGISRETVLGTLHGHTEMIDLNPLVIERHPIKPPREASPEEINCEWYSVTDKITYIPGVYTGKLTFRACFHDLPDGLQSHILAPTGLDIKGRWTLGGSLPGEPRQAVEIGLNLPKVGLWLKEDVDMKCNMMATGFVKKSTKKAHSTLVQRLIEKSHLKDNEAYNHALAEQVELRNSYPPDYHSSTSMMSPSSTYSSPPQGYDTKPPIQQHASYSSDNRGSVVSGNSSFDDAEHPYYAAAKPAPLQPRQSQSYRPYPQTIPTQELPVHQPYTNQLHTNITVELPGQEARTPIEIENARSVHPQS
ncbi:uncharacterized protein KY384_004575 [Bacidia gigantensis]|uniref:uncharacterized protein n=1 Tax=Bacidia gigantensis TaxID=2732470 RepID=UPI001D04D519|nr:uncharacterized protein KY384_004575 [Bacidia gigantensis]KAG8531217.1 hypothetical protein KY384_004575 [Bacidia gigantensis]